MGSECYLKFFFFFMMFKGVIPNSISAFPFSLCRVTWVPPVQKKTTFLYIYCLALIFKTESSKCLLFTPAGAEDFTVYCTMLNFVNPILKDMEEKKVWGIMSNLFSYILFCE